MASPLSQLATYSYGYPRWQRPLLHPRVGKQGVAEFTQDGPVYGALHVASPGHFSGRNLDLAAVPIRILDGCPVDDTVEPQPRGHSPYTWGKARRWNKVYIRAASMLLRFLHASRTVRSFRVGRRDRSQRATALRARISVSPRFGLSTDQGAEANGVGRLRKLSAVNLTSALRVGFVRRVSAKLQMVGQHSCESLNHFGRGPRLGMRGIHEPLCLL